MIYAINRKTKEHRIVPRLDVYSNHDWRYAVADADGWIEWGGGECPLPKGARFEVRRRDGEEVESCFLMSTSWSRDYGDRGSEIIAYRPILDTMPEAPEWRGPQDGNPPAGTPVIVLTKECDSAAMVLANDHNIVVVRYESGLGFKYGGFDLSDVRPIRSEEDRAVEEMARIIADGHDVYIGAHEAAERIYRAGYRKTSTADGEDV